MSIMGHYCVQLYILQLGDIKLYIVMTHSHSRNLGDITGIEG